MALIEALDDTLADAETKILRKTFGDVRVEPLVNLLSNGLAEVEAKAHGDTLDQVESKARVDMHADTLVDMHGETFIETLMYWPR